MTTPFELTAAIAELSGWTVKHSDYNRCTHLSGPHNEELRIRADHDKLCISAGWAGTYLQHNIYASPVTVSATRPVNAAARDAWRRIQQSAANWWVDCAQQQAAHDDYEGAARRTAELLERRGWTFHNGNTTTGYLNTMCATVQGGSVHVRSFNLHANAEAILALTELATRHGSNP